MDATSSTTVDKTKIAFKSNSIAIGTICRSLLPVSLGDT